MNNNINNKENIEIWISRILKFGLLLSVFCMIAGLLLVLFSPSSEINLTKNPSLAKLFEEILYEKFNSIVLILLGLVILMLTPILRVITTIIVFTFEKDWRFVAVSFIVFSMLMFEIIYSLFI